MVDDATSKAPLPLTEDIDLFDVGDDDDNDGSTTPPQLEDKEKKERNG